MSEKLKKFLNKIEKESGNLPEDLHVTRKACALVAISGGKVIMMEEPQIHHCPLFTSLFSYENLGKNTIEKKFDRQVKEWGMFTCKRHVCDEKIIVPFGASEMIMYALKKKSIDAAVTVCDGAGTVITSNPAVVQGIGAYMNGLFYTTPIPEVISNIQNNINKDNSSYVLSPKNAEINQFKGVKLALRKGFKKIAVSVRGDEEKIIRKIRKLEEELIKINDIKITILAICNTGINKKQAEVIRSDSDLAWACASKHIRDIAGPDAILQVGMKIPVFVLTDKGLDFITSYSSDSVLREKLIGKTGKCSGRHYITSGKYEEGAIKMRMGKFSVFLYETCKLPVGTFDEPEPLI
jgi:putative methanogenesis marker protein 8